MKTPKRFRWDDYKPYEKEVHEQSYFHIYVFLGILVLAVLSAWGSLYLQYDRLFNLVPLLDRLH